MEVRQPKVSIVTVCYNSAATIRGTIESVLSQNYPSIEYIIVDGRSSDETLGIIAEYRERIAVVISESDRGIYDAMNKGIGMATGDIVGTLNSDDFYAGPGTIGELVDTLLAARADAVFADLVYVDRDNPARVRRYYYSGLWRPWLFRIGLMPAHPTILIRREWYQRVGLFSLSYRIAADFEMLVRVFYRGRATYAYLNKPVVVMRMGGMSTRDAKHRLLLNQEIVKACRVNGIWTNMALLALKLPVRLIELVRGSLCEFS